MSRVDTDYNVSVVVGERGPLGEWSQQAADYLNSRDDKFDQQDMVTLVAPSDREAFISAFDHARETGDASLDDVTVLTPDGTATHEVNAHCTYVSEREIVEVTITPHSDQDGYQQDVEAEAEFAAIIAHDLRNPLNIIKGRLELARKTGDLSHLNRTEEAIDRMDRLIDDVLALAQSDERAIETHETSLGSLIRDDTWTGFEADSASLKTGNLPTVEGDYDSLCRLFENLFRECY